MMSKETITVLIATRNRIKELQKTLNRSAFLLNDERVKFIICDDNSSDDTYDYLKKEYPKIKLLRNERQMGIFYSRNLMFNNVESKYAITIDDDINFVSAFDVNNIFNYFKDHPKCAIMAFRIFWGIELPNTLVSNEIPKQVKSFGAGGHAIKIEDWKSIPKLPDWFVFYGEEDFMSIQLFKRGKEVHYTPDFFVHHRVDLKKRKKEKDYIRRLRLSLRSGWYLYVLFYPLKTIPKRFVYTLWIQFKTKVFKGDFKAFIGISQALFDLLFNMIILVKNSNRLSEKEFLDYSKLSNAKLYWSPEKIK